MDFLLTSLLAFGAACLFIWVLVPIAKRIGLVDRPSGRKTHEGEVPTIGGLAVMTAVVVTALVLGFSEDVHPAFWAGLIVIMLVGTLDDLRELGHHSKFVAQIAAAALMVFWAGWHLHSLGNLVGNWPLELGALALPFSFFAVIGVINGVNFTDGADGLAGGLVFNALLWFAVMEAMSDPASNGSGHIVFAFLGATAGFLAFNLRTPWRKRASVFLGDSGSLAMGYLLAWLMVSGAERAAPLFAPVTAIWLLSVPLVDTLACTGRRLLAGSSPFKADRKHMHHILMDLGLSARTAVASILCAAFVLGAVAVAAWHYRVSEYVMFYIAMMIFAAYLVYSTIALRAIEIRRRALARRTLRTGVPS